MFKLTAIVLVFGLLTSAYAATPWEVIYKSEETAKTETGFTIFQARHPDLFNTIDPKTIETAFISTAVLQFKGEHTCQPGDSRLFHHSFRYGYCQKEKDEDPTNNCTSVDSLQPEWADPCHR